LDLRRAHSAGGYAEGWPPRGVLVSLSFLFLVFEPANGLAWNWPADAVVCRRTLDNGVAFCRLLRQPKAPLEPHQSVMFRGFRLLTLADAMLFTSFTLLCSPACESAFTASIGSAPLPDAGGLGVLRIVHRVAAVIMIVRESGTRSISCTVEQASSRSLVDHFPRLKDVTDFIAVSLYYLGWRMKAKVRSV